MTNLKNDEAEMSIIGAVFLDNSSLDSIPFISPAHFACPEKAKVFSAMLKLHHNSKPIDAVTIRDELKISSNVIASYIDLVPTADNIRYYANQVKDCYTRRQLLASSSSIADIARGKGDINHAIDAAEASVLNVRGETDTNTRATLSQRLKSTFKNIEYRYENRGKIIGTASGFRDLDEITCGFEGGQLIILAARPAMGKTAFVVNMAENICDAGGKALIFTLEMSGGELLKRVIASRARVDSTRLRSGNLADSDFPKMSQATDKISRWQLEIEDNPAQTLYTISSVCRREVRQAKKEGKKLDAVIIDYLQLMGNHDKSILSRERQVAEISRGLKILAKQLDVPIIVLCQLNRDLEKRQIKRPIMADLRESGAIEQDADLIMFLNRETVYCADCKDQDKVCMAGHENDAELIIEKQRNGPIGTVKLAFFGAVSRFETINKKSY